MESEAPELTVEVVTGRDADARVAIIGDLDMGAAATLADAIDEIVATSPSSVTLDLAGITFLDSSGLGALLTLHGRCQTEGIPVSAINPPAQVSRVLELTNLTGLFNFR